MIVYVVVDRDYTEYERKFCCLFDSYEKAERYIAENNGVDKLTDYKILECDTSVQPEFDYTKPIYRTWRIKELIKNGEVRQSPGVLTTKVVNHIQKRGRYAIECYITLDKETTDEEAKKIAIDHITKWKEENK